MNKCHTFGRRDTTAPPPSPQPSADLFAGAPNINVEVVELKPVRNSGNLKAFASVKFGKWIILKGFRVVAQPGQAPWVGLPANSREEEDPDKPGQKKRVYFALCVIARSWQSTAEQAVLDAWQEYESTGVLPGGRVIGGGAAR